MSVKSLIITAFLLISVCVDVYALIDIDAYSASGVRTMLNIPCYVQNNSIPPEDEATHPDVLYVPRGWHGYTYWMAFTPYPNNTSLYENPSIVASNDNIHWSVPTFPNNPINTAVITDTLNHTPYNSDPDLVFSPQGDTLFCIWRRLENWTLETIYYMSTTDGVHWTSPENVLIQQSSMNGTCLISPSIIYSNGKYRLWNVKCPYVHIGYDPVDAPRKVQYREANNLSELRYAPIKETNVLPFMFEGQYSFKQTWHINVVYSHGFYWMINQVGSYSPLGGDLYLGYSEDGINWTFGSNPILLRRPSEWDKVLYRASILPIDDGTMNFRIWYSCARVNRFPSKIGYTETTGGDILPVATTPTAISYNGFTAQWYPIMGAQSYLLNVFEADGITYVAGYKNKVVNDIRCRVDNLNSNTLYKYNIRVNNGDTGCYSNTINVYTLNVLNGEGANTSFNGEPTRIEVQSVQGGPPFLDNEVVVDPDDSRYSDFYIDISWTPTGFNDLVNARLICTINTNNASALNGIYQIHHKGMGFIPTAVRYKYDTERWKFASFTSNEDSTIVIIRGLRTINYEKLVIAFNDGHGTFPVDLQSFSSSIYGHNLVQLDWTSSCEEEISHYMILRSTSFDPDTLTPLNPIINIHDIQHISHYRFIDYDHLNKGTYYYWLKSVDIYGIQYLYGNLSVDIDDSLSSSDQSPPSNSNLVQIYPNPFSHSTSIMIDLPFKSLMRIEIYNLKGERIQKILEKTLEKGTHRLMWDGTDDSNHKQQSGVYILKFSANNEVTARKLILLK